MIDKRIFRFAFYFPGLLPSKVELWDKSKCSKNDIHYTDKEGRDGIYEIGI